MAISLLPPLLSFLIIRAYSAGFVNGRRPDDTRNPCGYNYFIRGAELYRINVADQRRGRIPRGAFMLQFCSCFRVERETRISWVRGAGGRSGLPGFAGFCIEAGESGRTA